MPTGFGIWETLDPEKKPGIFVPGLAYMAKVLVYLAIFTVISSDQSESRPALSMVRIFT